MYMLYVIMHSITLAITEKELLLPRTFAYNVAKQVKKLLTMCMCQCCRAKEEDIYSNKKKTDNNLNVPKKAENTLTVPDKDRV
jgi:hypothetical protein